MAKGKSSISKTAVWVLLGLLILGLGGFGATNLSGTVRTIGTVGDKTISVDRYARQLQQQIRSVEQRTGEALPFAQAQQFGIDQAVLQSLVQERALDHEAAELGISVGDAAIRDRILDIPAFQGIDGNFDRESYRFALEQNGFTEAEFETQMREEVARTLLRGAIQGGVAMPDAFTDTLVGYVGERRDFTWTQLDEAGLETPLEPADDATLRAFYDDNIGLFTLPRTKRITYAVLTPDMLVDSVDIDDAALRAAYEDRSAEFNQPERRLVERLAFIDDAAAAQAAERIAAGESFETIVEGRGLALQDIDLGDIAQDALGEAGAAVFDAEVGAVVGPLPSDLGPALYRVNGVLPAMSIPFEEAVEGLRPQVAADRAQRLVDAQAQNLDDLLAGGATLEDLAQETDMELGAVDWFTGSDAEIAAYEAFRETAQATTAEDFPAIERLDDGGLFALRVDEVLEPRPAPFAEVIDDVRAEWRSDAVAARLAEQAESLLPRLRAGESFAEIGFDAIAEENMLRSDSVPGAPPDLITRVFQMDPGDAELLRGDGVVVLVRLDAVNGPDLSGEAGDLRDQLGTQSADALAQDVFNAFAGDVLRRANPQINQQALQAVHVNFP